MSRLFEDKDGKYGGLAEYVYLSPAHQFIDLIDPKDLNLVGGRGLGKTTVLHGQRSLRIQKAMPGAYFAFVGDYYSNLLGNTVPSMIKGWNDLGYKEGIDYVTNEEPPKHFAKPYKKPLSYKHTISWRNGCFYKLASMDVVSSLAGDSYQHVFGDEVKYIAKSKLDKLLPAKRGEKLRFGGSHYYLGTTFTTDMPNVLAPNEYDWILDQEELMNVEKIELILKCSLEVNEIKEKLVKAYVKKDRNEIEKQKRAFYRWNERLMKTRFNSNLFYVVSSMAIADIHGLDWFNDQLDLLGIEGFKAAILSMKQEVSEGEKFYPRLDDTHFYDEGLIMEFFDNFSFGEKPEITSRALRFIQHNRKLEAGVDFGTMMSIVVGQEQGRVQRILKNIFTLGKDVPELAKEFGKFFKYHQYKVLDLYYDRSGNQWKQIGRDMATNFKNALESLELDGIRQNWRVNLMSEGQGTIYQQQEYVVVNQMLLGSNPRLPRILIDNGQCMQLKASLKLSVQILKTDKEGIKTIHKNKTSEKLALSKLPMQSTNFSDALKYYLCRPRYMELVRT